MPFVKASQAKDHLELVKNGTVRKISGFVPDDNGDFILVVFMNPTRMSKLNQSGLGFNADMMIAGSARPKKYGKLHGNLAKGVFVHLCTKKTCHSFQHAVHLGEWAYLSEEDDGAATGDAGRLLHALGPDGVQRVHGSPAEEEEEEAEVLHGAAPASPSPDPIAGSEGESQRRTVRDGWAVPGHAKSNQACRCDRQVVQGEQHHRSRGGDGLQRCRGSGGGCAVE